jgi:hypothetical protein
VSERSRAPNARRKTRVRDVWIATGGALLGVIITGVVSIMTADPGPNPSPSTTTVPPPIVTISEPRPGSQVPWCTTVRGSASIAPDQALVVADLEKDDDQIYFESAVIREASGQGWSVTVKLGEEKDKTSIGNNYTIYVVVMKKDFVEYLKDVSGKTWWSSSATKDIDTLVSKKIEVPVTRNGKLGDC